MNTWGNGGEVGNHCGAVIIISDHSFGFRSRTQREDKNEDCMQIKPRTFACREVKEGVRGWENKGGVRGWANKERGGDSAHFALAILPFCHVSVTLHFFILFIVSCLFAHVTVSFSEILC